MGKCLYIELGMTQIRVAVAVQSGKSVKVTDAFWISTPQGSIEDGIVRDTRSVGERLKEALAERNLHKVYKTVFTVFTSRIATRTVSIPYVKIKQIQAMIETNAAEYFPIDMTQYNMSYQILDTEENEGVKNYRLMVYAAPKLLTTAFVEVADTAGLTIDKIDYMGNSIYQAFGKEYASGVHMVIKLEENTTLITILQDGKLELQRSLNYGIDPAIEVIQSAPDFPAEGSYLDAYEILREQQCTGDVADALRYVSGNILRIVDYYISRHADREFDSIAVAGMGAEWKELCGWLGSELGMEVVPAAPMNHSGFTTELSEDGSTSAFYLAVLGSMVAPVNLADTTRHAEKIKSGMRARQEQSLRGAFVVLITAAAASLLLIIVAGGIRGYEYYNKKSLESKIEKLKPMEDLYNQYKNAKTEYDNFISMYGITDSPNEQLVSFFQELEAKMPTSVNIAAFTSTGAGIDMSLTAGSKADAAKVLMQLREFESLMDVHSGGISVSEGGTVEMNVTANYAEPAMEMSEDFDTDEVLE